MSSSFLKPDDFSWCSNDEDTEDGKLFGYNMQSVAVLKNKMKDDIDIIYYQLKKSAEKEQRRKREI